jgi:ketosteroid isomerase-like protein
MSQENVEIVRRAIDAWNVGDMERLRELYSPRAIVRRAVRG